ncbi:hypothetical protein AQUCO_04300047v1 [Aquilegia coerulea]|uniref:CRAL-TRIO domain-containing protein n=1 Tax=Aquilegia coerulea TaxID=218851 RepID=A0A2G5CNJ1_AQUCA|nr:hypothetical protein AQUCO_04300047v1 [Aquilegia coerulea]
MENSKHDVGEVEMKEGNNLKNSNGKEQHELVLMRTYVESQDPTTKEVDDKTLRRFLRARDLNVEKASAMFLKYLNWRRVFIPNGSISESEISNELAQKKVFLQGHDKEGRPIEVVFGAKHFPNKTKGGLEEFKRFVVYALEKICSRMPGDQEKFTAIGDGQGWGYSNFDLRAYLGALSILQDCYPERLGKLYLVHVPVIFMTAWKIISPFIDSNTRNKIVFVEDKKLTSTLLEAIDESQLPEIYGGKLQLVPIQES